MIDPQVFPEAFKTTKTLPNPTLPTGTPSHVAPIPSVVPNKPIWQHAHQAGHKTLWVLFVLMLISSLVFIAMAWRTPIQKRFYHVITTFIVVFSTLAYYAQATGTGSTFIHYAIRESHKHVPDTVDHVFRQLYWARYVDWALTSPLILLDLSVLAGLSGANIVVVILTDLIMVLTGLFAAFGRHGGTKWGWYAMSCVAYLVIVYQILVQGRASVKTHRDAPAVRLFTTIGTYTVIVWLLYPIVWGISEGAHNWSVDAEIIAYAVLDILAKPVFGFWLLFAHGKNIESIDGFWAHGVVGEGRIRIGEDEEA